MSNELRQACMRIARRVRFESDDAIAPHQVSVLVHLTSGPMSPGELADRDRVTAPSMTRTVAGLVEAGWAEREADPHDGRRVLITITDRGRTALGTMRHRRDRWMFTRVQRLSARDQATLARAAEILHRLADE